MIKQEKAMVIHESPDWRETIKSVLEKIGSYDIILLDSLPEEIEYLDTCSIVFVSVSLAMASLSKLLTKDRKNLVVTIPMEGFSSYRQWKIYKLERVNAKISKLPATEEGIYSFILDKIRET